MWWCPVSSDGAGMGRTSRLHSIQRLLVIILTLLWTDTQDKFAASARSKRGRQTASGRAQRTTRGDTGATDPTCHIFWPADGISAPDKRRARMGGSSELGRAGGRKQDTGGTPPGCRAARQTDRRNATAGGKARTVRPLFFSILSFIYRIREPSIPRERRRPSHVAPHGPT
jgi:hypothetical protein